MQRLTIALGVWAAIGPIVGILVGHFLTRSWQREQWIRDHRWQEYQELLKAITSAYMAMIQLNVGRRAMSDTSALEREIASIKHDSFRVVRDRIIIAGELAFEDILGTWDAAVTNFDNDGEERIVAKRFTELNERLVEMALRPARFGGGLFLWRHRERLAAK